MGTFDYRPKFSRSLAHDISLLNSCCHGSFKGSEMKIAPPEPAYDRGLVTVMSPLDMIRIYSHSTTQVV